MINEIGKIDKLIHNKKYKEAVEEARKHINNKEINSFIIPQYAVCLRKAKLYDELVKCYEKVWVENDINFSNWDNKHYAFSLRKTENYNKCIEVCEKVKKNNPSFKPILGDYYWAIYYRDIKKWHIEEVDEDVILAYVEKVKEEFKDDKNRHFTPYNSSILYLSEYYFNKSDYEKCCDWLKNINVDELNKVGKFIKKEKIIDENNPETYFIKEKLIVYAPNKAKYYNYFSSSLVKLKKYEEAKPLVIKALYDFPFWEKVSVLLLEIAENEFGSKGISVFHSMLTNAGFNDDKIRDNYLKALLGYKIEYTANWDERFVNQVDYERKYQVVALARALKRLYREIEIKDSLYIKKEVNFNNVSSSEIGDFVFCPASYSIQKSFQVIKDAESDIELMWDEKKILLDRIELYDTHKEIDKTFSEEELLKIGNIPENLGFIFKSKVLQENKRNRTPEIFHNEEMTFHGVPDYWLSNSYKYVSEEKFTRYSQQTEEMKTPFANHKAEILSQIIELKQLEANEGYIVYWLWNFERVEYNGKPSTYYKLQNAKIFKIELSEFNLKFYDSIISKVRRFNKDKSMKFDMASLSANKCVNCGVSQYCFHKTGRFDELILPHNEN